MQTINLGATDGLPAIDWDVVRQALDDRISTRAATR